ncbi:ABC transporter substrate-binding protein [Ralstonia solanacearum]|uniref:ABC transporter substrate-binding protein n=1 Tax=Ralstonia solanacearum TaxID=305 RepID=A0AAW5ZUA6_RALSL|nr:ABC transporter substrate-binding protein [Ralstonia solanacearum]MDB0573173.1 ABC transporter substrate-binding protein [Ralstonia solanacearum]
MMQDRLRILLGTLAAIVIGAMGFAAHAQTGVTADSIVVGQSAPLSGAAAPLGQQLSLGARLYFNAVNAAGGIHGRKIDFRVLDDAFDPDLTTRNTRTLINNAKAFALFGYVGTQSSLAAMKLANPEGIPFFAPYAGAQSLREPFVRNVFHVRAGFNDETAAIVQQIRVVGLKRIAVIHNDDAFGRAGLEGVHRALAFPANQGLVLAAQAGVGRYTTDVRAALATVLAQKPDVIVVVCGYQTVTALVHEAKAQGYVGQLYNLSLVGSNVQTKELGAGGNGVVISQVMPYPRKAATPIVREYQKLLKSNGITEFDYGSLEGYVAARAFVEGLRRAGRDLTRDKFIRALEAMNHYDMDGFMLNFTPSNHLGSSFVDMTIVNAKGQVIR